MEKSQRPRLAMVLLAALFLLEAWVWDAFVAVGRRLVALIPWAAFKARVAAWLERTPIFIVLAIYIIPLLIIEPLKTVSVYVMATGHFAFGVVAFIVLQFLTVGVVGVIFDLTRARLLTVPWFAWVYEKVMIFHHFADRLLAPYKEAAKREWGAFRQRVRDYRARLAAASK
ncbi:MAG TPA: hypothetical protein VGY52_15460 [Roseiarcus sp.]|jgi:hypothetical protein|nr:hypothetical protein [Roseiarcus sp.]